jgi:hypothetical protein
MSEMTNSTSLVKELFPKTVPKRFYGNGKFQPKTRIYFLSCEPKNSKREVKHF